MNAPRNVGRYVVHAELASGGMATVHLAKLKGPLGFSRTVAIKQLHAHYAKDPDFVAMLLDEARLAGRIQHPNVVSPIDVVSEGGEVSVVMEYVHGEPLHRLVRALPKDERMALPFVSAVVSGVLHGLHAAHEALDEKGEPLGIVHRDVSPQNVIVGIDGVARVLDFGIAKATGRIQTTRDGQIKGKLAYMAPEQCRSLAVGPRTDVYAVGVILWELLAGRRLFRGDNDASILEQVLLGVVRPPSRWVPALPSALDTIVMRALERDPELRFATAREMAMALEDVVSPASARELGAFVVEASREVLDARSELLARIDSAGDATSAGKIRASLATPSGATKAERALEPALVQAAVVDGSEREPVTDVTIAEELPPPLQARRRRFALFVSAVLALAVLIGGAAFVRSRSDAHSAADSEGRPDAPLASSLGATIAPLPAASAASAHVASLPAPPATSPSPVHTASAKPKKPLAKPLTKSETATKPGCDPPFYYDTAYKKHYKTECL